MSTPVRTSNEPAHSSDEVEKSTRKSYEPPRILSREPLEALANVCNQPGSKGDPGLPQCGIGPIQS